MKVTDEWLYEKMPIVDAAMVRQLEVCTQKKITFFSDKFRKRMKRLIQKKRKYMYAEKQLKKITQKIAAAAVVIACGSTHRHDECGGLPGTVFSYDKNGAGW